MQSFARYDNWNQALADRYFTKEQSGRPVYLDTDDELLAEVGHTIGSGEWRDDLIASVRTTLDWSGVGVLHSHLKRLNAWRVQSRRLRSDRGAEIGPPPVVALLTLLTRNAGEMGTDGGFAAHAYYPPLRKMLGLNEGRGDPVRLCLPAERRGAVARPERVPLYQRRQPRAANGLLPGAPLCGSSPVASPSAIHRPGSTSPDVPPIRTGAWI